MLLGFEAPSSGNILFDKQDLKSVDARLIRRQMGVVLQDGKLMPGDLFTNIIGASTNLTMDDAWAAAKASAMEGDIHNMPMGMHTMVSEGANTLSGGQRQRLMIARAIVNKPRVLIFDEATSALDNRTQSIITESLNALRATKVVVAHRLSTIKAADRIYYLEKGKIMEDGNFEELMALKGHFYRLAERQLS
jgi:ATP-binding cassette subfamily C protein